MRPDKPEKHRGFLYYKREELADEPPGKRIAHWDEFTEKPAPDKIKEQAYRCMDCGVPFCQSGCPLGNIIPDFNDLVKDDHWKEALDNLHSTNNFPEFTGRVCPAPCEAACVLGINEPPVTIKIVEKEIGDRGWKEDWIKPEPPAKRTGKRVAIVGSGPAGLAAAQQLNRAGHSVVVYERDDEAGGLLTYGIPDFKLNKEIVRRRLRQMEQEGVEFRCNAAVGTDVPVSELDEYDASLITTGATQPRDLPIPGRELDGIHFAMDFLTQQNRRVSGKEVHEAPITAKDKRVVILGGGDTGSDCHGTSIRQGAAEVWSFELLPKPPDDRADSTPWPMWPLMLRTSSSHEEGGKRDWSVLTKAFSGEDGRVKKLHGVRLTWEHGGANGRPQMKEVPGSEFEIECELVLLALGFVHPEHSVPNQMGLELDERGNVKADEVSYKTSREGVFAAGDARRGQSLVVWAISEGREAARSIDFYLMGHTDLPSKQSYGYDALLRQEGATA